MEHQNSDSGTVVHYLVLLLHPAQIATYIASISNGHGRGRRFCSDMLRYVYCEEESESTQSTEEWDCKEEQHQELFRKGSDPPGHNFAATAARLFSRRISAPEDSVAREEWVL